MRGESHRVTEAQSQYTFSSERSLSISHLRITPRGTKGNSIPCATRVVGQQPAVQAPPDQKQDFWRRLFNASLKGKGFPLCSLQSPQGHNFLSFNGKVILFPLTISKTPSWMKYAFIALQRSLFDQLAVPKITGNSLPEAFAATGEKKKLPRHSHKYPIGSF